ncbi:Usp36 protein [Mycena maculata]|uniref:Ubiquitin carboxyl-terminal hydrolase n=1 Tax=Mycena maculata TaxID=230809 RepID=A0AAD7MK50_9AGAR|nr:Usp36 protein [Mycena maculata]
MLASPLYAAPAPFTSQSEVARDIESFNKRLPAPVEFIEGSSSGALAVPEGRYEPINATPKAGKTERPRNVSPPPSPAKASTSGPKAAPLYNGTIDIAWPLSSNVASGLYNSGNTCFLNSALQCLFHTPPLLCMLVEHTELKCPVKRGVFCMACSLRKVATEAHKGQRPFAPSAVSGKLQVIAKHMRKGRQEDSHEFLRYAIDALQKSCLAGHPPKIDPLLAETTWVHKIFGGRLRSRVQCTECQHNSDTFDSILDLSLDIHNQSSVKQALRKFVAPDMLKGADKYKCEKCKKPVVAEKRFSVHEAPMVLTVHLKRFTPMGRKIGNHVEYDERLLLKPYMSEGQHGPAYSLYGVICHAGGGPNSGHYYAFVKSRSGRWCEMNDEAVTAGVSAPVGLRNAYILFYLRDKGQGLDAAVNANAAPTPQKPVNGGSGIIAGMKKKRSREDDTEDAGVKVSKPFIGPQLPSSPCPEDPQAARVREKIAAASKAMESVDAYGSDGEDTELAHSMPPPSSLPPSSPLPPTTLATTSPAVAAAASSPAPAPVPAASFYGASAHKRKHSESFGSSKDHDRFPKRSPFVNPFGKDRFASQQYGKKRNKGRPRGL